MNFNAIALLLLFSFSASATLVGNKAPDFNLVNENNQTVKLSDFKGKYIVLEWLNHGCPFVKKHYNSQNMQSLQKKIINKDTVWLSIISSAEGKQGYSTSEEALKNKKEFQSNAGHILLDTKGEVGQAYQAKTTPHMFIISKEGDVIYEGAIDSIASADPEDIKDSENYITKAFEEINQGKKISVQKTKSYGCSVKY